MSERPTKITFAEMRDIGVRGVLIYCADYRCSHSVAVTADRGADDVRMSDIGEPFLLECLGIYAGRYATKGLSVTQRAAQDSFWAVGARWVAPQRKAAVWAFL
jgi:hypothetical protein